MSREFKPTFLYIKQHSVTGMKYFGKTTKSEKFLLESYSGSGTYWLRHINKHGATHVTTIWYKLFSDLPELVAFAEKFSDENNIVKSAAWANCKSENGLAGGDNGIFNKGKTRSSPPWNKGLPKELNPRTGKKLAARTAEHSANIAIAKQGHTPWNKGLTGLSTAWNKGLVGAANPLTNRTRPPRDLAWSAKIAEANKGVPRPRDTVVCPHCGKAGDKSLMTRWHFTNCKV